MAKQSTVDHLLKKLSAVQVLEKWRRARDSNTQGPRSPMISSRLTHVEQLLDQPIVSKNLAHVGSWIWWGQMRSDENAVGQVLGQVTTA